MSLVTHTNENNDSRYYIDIYIEENREHFSHQTTDNIFNVYVDIFIHVHIAKKNNIFYRNFVN